MLIYVQISRTFGQCGDITVVVSDNNNYRLG